MEDIQSTQLPQQHESMEPTNVFVADGVANVGNVNDSDNETAATFSTTTESESAESQLETKTPEELKACTEDDLVAYVHSLMQASSARQVLKAVNDVRAEVRRRVDDVVAEEKKKFEEANATAEGEAPAAVFEHVPSKFEQNFDDLFKRFDEALNAEREELRKVHEANAVKKQALIDEMKQIVDNLTENPSQLLRQVKDINSRWKEVGPVAPDKKALNQEFRSLTDQYFSKLNVDRELRELDMRHNLEQKIRLCEEVEALKDEANASKAFYQVQRLHATWKSIGPVPSDQRESIWDRFREATSVINKRYHKQAEADHEREKVNYEQKTQICVEAEAVAAKELKTAKDYDEATKAILELQKKWRTIGFAPKEVNDEIYARFRAVCDKIFDGKRVFFKEQNNQLSENMKLKEALCEKAEAVMNSTDWNKTANILKDLQKQWKEVGAVSYKQSDAIWKRFRKACDTFFDNRQRQLDGEKDDMEQNLTLKKAVIEELKNFQPSEDANEHLKQVQAFISRWNAIGYVPMSAKQAINKEYSDLIGKHFDQLNLGPADSELQRFRTRMEAMAADDKFRVTKERTRLQQHLRQAETDVETLENNILFFAKSKKSDGIVAEVKVKIEKAKADAAQIAKKIAILDEILG